MSNKTIGSGLATAVYQPDAVFVEHAAKDYPLSQKILSGLSNVPVYEIQNIEQLEKQFKTSKPDVFGEGKKNLVLSRFQGSFLKKCPGASPGMVCCNYYVVNLSKNCIYDCSYCFLQNFLSNNPLQVAFVNIEDLFQELEEVFTQYPDRTFRVGTGEITDSLALDSLVPYSQLLIPFFNRQKNAVLELKTKSDRIENLLDQPDPTNVIVSWSINPQQVVDLEEKGTPSLEKRLHAASQCVEKGYRVGFHLDPIILIPGWEKAYRELVDTLFDFIPASRMEWVSLGSFRYRSSLKPIIKSRHPETMLFTGEHLPGKDGKFRYLRPLRNKAYETIRGFLQEKSQDLSIYLCMETKEIWEGVTGKTPRSDEKLDAFFDL
ncbi:MAG: radical SAM protein [Nitrospinae bacterium]|nr:radical SAM protein [Nitrospinota bacterium]